MFTIRLDKMRFFAHHGWHDEEGITGTEFEVSIAASFDPVAEISSLADTINYVDIFDLVKKRFSQPTKLLETLATDISKAIKTSDPRISAVYIRIDKLNPPIRNFSGTAGVEYNVQF